MQEFGGPADLLILVNLGPGHWLPGTGTALETIIFEDQYPYDLTKVSNSDFLNMTELGSIYIRNTLGSEEELSYESIRMR